MRRTALALLLVVVLAVPALAQEALEDPIPEGIRSFPIPVTLESVADGFTAPLWGTTAPDHEGYMWVVDQDGELFVVELASGDTQVVADLSGLLVDLGAFGPRSFDERGFLGVAFHPDYADNGLLYTYTSQPADAEPDFSTMPDGVEPNHQSVIAEWQVFDPSDPWSEVDTSTRREILRVDQPQFNHNAGALFFDDTGALFIAMGDGGAADDQGPGHAPDGNGQTPSNILGNILRIDPLGSDSAGGAYGIPTDNPFAGVPTVLDEIFAWGFRNPYRTSIDMRSGDIWAGDVGQNDIEEVDLVEAGQNYGWRHKEGSFLFDPNGADPGFVIGKGEVPGTNLTDPVVEYDHDEGISVIGGFVYHGDEVPWLKRRYVFGEFRNPQDGESRLFALFGRRMRELNVPGDLGPNLLLGFGQDADGEVYALTNQTSIPFPDEDGNPTGMIWRLDWR